MPLELTGRRAAIRVTPSLRRFSLARYGLADLPEGHRDTDLQEVVDEARRRLDSTFAAIDVVTVDGHARIAEAGGLPLGSTPGDDSAASRVLDLYPDGYLTTVSPLAPTVLSALRVVPELRDVAFYACAPFVSREGVVLCLLSAWSPAPIHVAPPGAMPVLASLVGRIRDVLELRRNHRTTAIVAGGAPRPVPPGVGEDSGSPTGAGGP